MHNRLNTFLHDSTPTFVAVFGVAIYDIHQVLSVLTLAVTLTYSCMKLKQDFFNNKNKN